RLSRADWANAALEAIAEGGLAAVAIEPLATRLGTTKGSFYWHFANREALLEEALSVWEARDTTAVLAGIGEGEPAQRLRRLISLVVERAERDRIGPALLSTADHPAVAPVLARVAETRIGSLGELFAELGLPAAEARSRALLAYSAYLGHAQLAHSTPHLIPQTKAARRRYLEQVIAVLT
ncbi:MAG: TetR/AcrR family transcriptional regulator, partial [Actinomadura sp.]